MFMTKIATLVAFLSVAANAHRDENSFDYVIVGGGTAGCVLAAELSTDFSKTVALIEAGDSVFDNPLVKTIFSAAGPALGTDIDWNYTTVPQAYADNATLIYHAGKALGGTSTINGMIYLRPTSEEVDNWAALGNPGPYPRNWPVDWRWNNLLQWYKKSEELQPPDESQSAQGASYAPNAHGRNGHVKVGWYPGLNTTGFGQAFNSTWQSFGFSWNADANTGNDTGLTLFPSQRDNTLNIREDAARAYYWGVANRPNLRTFVNTTALKVMLGNETSRQRWHEPKVCAEGVEVELASGERMVLKATREVILSAGTYRTPGLLEQSGIGNPSILKGLSITPRVDLPGVGAHFQDQWLINTIWDPNALASINMTFNTMPFEASLTAADLFGDDFEAVAAKLYADIPSYACTLSKASNGAISESAQYEILKLRVDMIVKKLVPIGVLQLGPAVGTSWGTMPLSTGNVHSSSNASKPNINPNFLQLDWDIQVQHRLSLLLRKIMTSPTLKPFVAGPELIPGTSVIPTNASYAAWTAYFRQDLAPVWHGVGTAGMRRRDYGGVVDEAFRVYGTKGLRVVDASVIPLQSNGNPTSSVYALAEMAAVLF